LYLDLNFKAVINVAAFFYEGGVGIDNVEEKKRRNHRHLKLREKFKSGENHGVAYKPTIC